jgi:hypothetical protein
MVDGMGRPSVSGVWHMRNRILATIGILSVTALAAPAFAHPGGGMGGGMGGGHGGGISGGFPGGGATGGTFPGGGATGRTFPGGAGGASGSTMSHTGATNTNGPDAGDRDVGGDRAEDRRTTSAGTMADAHSRAMAGDHHRQFGGKSASHISAKGLANTNGPNATDRDFGRDRAEDRRAMAVSGASVDTNARVSARAHHRRFGGASGAHISASGAAHTNGPNAADRDFGEDRASDRTGDR